MHIYRYLCVFGFGIKTVHSSVGAYEYPVSNSFNNPLAYLGHLFFLLRSHLSYYIIHLFPTLEIIAYTKTYSCIFLGAYEFVYVLQAVMSAVAALSADAQLAARQRNIVKNDENVFGRNLVECGSLPYGFAAVVHHCLGLEQQTALFAEDDFTQDALEFDLIDFDIFAFRQQIQTQKACVVARERIFCPRISQTDNQKIRGRRS